MKDYQKKTKKNLEKNKSDQSIGLRYQFTESFSIKEKNDNVFVVKSPLDDIKMQFLYKSFLDETKSSSHVKSSDKRHMVNLKTQNGRVLVFVDEMGSVLETRIHTSNSKELVKYSTITVPPTDKEIVKDSSITAPTTSDEIVKDSSITAPTTSDEIVKDSSITAPTTSDEIVKDSSITAPITSYELVKDSSITSPMESEPNNVTLVMISELESVSISLSIVQLNDSSISLESEDDSTEFLVVELSMVEENSVTIVDDEENGNIIKVTTKTEDYTLHSFRKLI